MERCAHNSAVNKRQGRSSNPSLRPQSPHGQWVTMSRCLWAGHVTQPWERTPADRVTDSERPSHTGWGKSRFTIVCETVYSCVIIS